MFEVVDIKKELEVIRSRRRKEADAVLEETRRILNKDLFTEKKILENLGRYNRSFELVDDERADQSLIFTSAEIKRASVVWRLKFLDPKIYKAEIPYEAVLRIKDYNNIFGRELKQFRILAPADSFITRNPDKQALLFALTQNDNYYLIHRWGTPLPQWRKWFYWPIRSFETLLSTVLLFTFAVTMSLPTWMITLDRHADYWSGYRTATFLHLFIFNLGFTAFITFAFTKNFSSSIWNKEKDFG